MLCMQMESVFEAVMTSFKNHIRNAAWMDEGTRATALDKADAVVHGIGYPDLVADPAQLDDYYEEV